MVAPFEKGAGCQTGIGQAYEESFQGRPVKRFELFQRHKPVRAPVKRNKDMANAGKPSSFNSSPSEPDSALRFNSSRLAFDRESIASSKPGMPSSMVGLNSRILRLGNLCNAPRLPQIRGK